MTNWTHDALADDLASSLVTPDRMIWEDIQLGPVGSPRPDVYVINKSFMRPNPTAYECKISVADFRADVTVGKWSSYLNYAHSVIFAVPAGLIAKDEVPQMCGLIVRHEKAWRLAKRATVNPSPIAQEALLKLLIDGIEKEGPRTRARMWERGDLSRKFDKKFGAVAARYVSDAASVHRDIEYAQDHRRKILEDAEKEAHRIREKAMLEAPLEWKALTSVLGLDVTADIWKVRRRIREINEAVNGGRAQMALESVLESLRRIITNNEHLAVHPVEKGADANEQ